MTINRTSFYVLGMMTLASVAPPSDAVAESNPPRCNVTVHNCHSSMKLRELRTHDSNGPHDPFNTLLPADDHYNLLPGQSTTLTCNTSNGCETGVTPDRPGQGGSVIQNATSVAIDPVYTSCNADLAFGRSDSDGSLAAYKNCNTPDQQGTLPSGTFNASLSNRHSGKCLDGDRPGNGVNVHQWECHSGDNQTLTFTPVAGTSNIYTAKFKHSNQCLEAALPSSRNGGNVQQWDCNGNGNQQIKIERVDTLQAYFHKLTFGHNLSALDINNSGTDNGTNIQIWRYTGYDNQLWSFYVR